MFSDSLSILLTDSPVSWSYVSIHQRPRLQGHRPPFSPQHGHHPPEDWAPHESHNSPLAHPSNSCHLSSPRSVAGSLHQHVTRTVESCPFYWDHQAKGSDGARIHEHLFFRNPLLPTLIPLFLLGHTSGASHPHLLVLFLSQPPPVWLLLYEQLFSASRPQPSPLNWIWCLSSSEQATRYHSFFFKFTYLL